MKTIQQLHIEEQIEAGRHATAEVLRRYLNSEWQAQQQRNRINDIDKLVMWSMGAAFGFVLAWMLK
jgi:hypothetical protein